MHAPLQAANEAELAAIRSRIEAALGAGVNEKRIADLLSLAQFQMLSRDSRVVRSPTVVLSMRPQRSTTLRHAYTGSCTTLCSASTSIGLVLVSLDCKGKPDLPCPQQCCFPCALGTGSPSGARAIQA